MLRIAFSFLLLVFIFSQVNLTEVLSVLSGADAGLLLLSMAALQMGVFIRSFRWWLLIREPVQFGHALQLVYIGEFVSGALPTGYAGDIARIVEFEGRSPKSAVAGTVLLDRILGLIGLLLLGLTATIIEFSALPSNVAISVLALSTSGILLAVLLLQGGMVSRLLRRLPKRWTKLRERWLAPLWGAMSGRSATELAAAVVLSLLNTVCTVLNHYAVALAVGISLALRLFFVFAPTINLGLLLPAINGLGAREIGYRLLLAPFGIPANIAVAVGIGLFVSRLSSSVIGGVIYFTWGSRRSRGKSSA